MRVSLGMFTLILKMLKRIQVVDYIRTGQRTARGVKLTGHCFQTLSLISQEKVKLQPSSIKILFNKLNFKAYTKFYEI